MISRGTTLLELLVSTSLGLLFISFAVVIYFTFKQHFDYQQSLIVRQRHFIIARQILYTAISRAGYADTLNMTLHNKLLQSNHNDITIYHRDYDKPVCRAIHSDSDILQIAFIRPGEAVVENEFYYVKKVAGHDCGELYVRPCHQHADAIIDGVDTFYVQLYPKTATVSIRFCQSNRNQRNNNQYGFNAPRNNAA